MGGPGYLRAAARPQPRRADASRFFDGPVTANKSARRPHGLGPDAEGRLPALQGAARLRPALPERLRLPGALDRGRGRASSSGSTRSGRSRSTGSRSSRASAASASSGRPRALTTRLEAARPVDGLGQRLLHLQRHEHRVRLADAQDRPRARLALHGPPLDRVVPALRHVDLAARADRLATSTGADPSLFVRFPLLDRRASRSSIWTTTPWTLPANVAAAVNPDAEYGRAGERRVGRGRALSRTRSSRSRRPGAELVGLALPRPVRRARARRRRRRIASSRGTRSRSTRAPASSTSRRARAPRTSSSSRVHDLPVLTPVDESGRFYDEYGWLHGLSTDRGGGADHRQPRGEGRARRGGAAQAPLSRVLALPHAADLPHRRRLVHLRPRRCGSRCSTRTRPSSGRREYMGKRMDDWLHNMGDWNISRRRYYGLPLPFYPCACGHLNVIGSRAELEERALGGPRAARGAAPSVDRPRADRAARSAASRWSGSRRSATSGSTPASSRSRRSAGRTPSGSPEGYATGAAQGADRPPTCPITRTGRSGSRPTGCRRCASRSGSGSTRSCFMSVVLTGRAPFRRVLGYEKMLDETRPRDARLDGQHDRGRARRSRGWAPT